MEEQKQSRLIVSEHDLANWQTTNQDAWNRLARSKHRLTTAANDEQFIDPLKSIDALGWIGSSVHGKHVLCLAAGGGRHGPLFAAAGAATTVVDLSPAMLQLDRTVATERGLTLRTIQTSMEDLSMLDRDEFDLVVQPVSSCYVPDIRPVYREVARVLRAGGRYISQHKQPVNLQSSLNTERGAYRIMHEYYRTQPIPAEPDFPSSPFREPGATEYLHRWEELLGELCRSGFVIEDVMEPYHANTSSSPGSSFHRSLFVPPYVRIKARRLGE
ncbi:MAG TPA: class I SAM-dependent methyltransferase [Pirellulaceae bacterium]|nr:class I SAM-dependent methyltransferase [Pirellulaceae bacterium]HMO92935.1 class I SAM-dependent methyltransferase [Pirellulaceae bacterium]HMP68500.1 class I SAM-dependent methyltransferase [Pirellulaceae bacterium]